MCGPKCRCQKCYEMHGSGPMVTNKMTTPTDTPRTDAARKGDWIHYTIAMMLEQELAASKAEVERLRAYLLTALNISTWTLGNSISNDQFQQFQAEIRRIKDSINYPTDK